MVYWHILSDTIYIIPFHNAYSQRAGNDFQELWLKLLVYTKNFNIRKILAECKLMEPSSGTHFSHEEFWKLIREKWSVCMAPDQTSLVQTTQTWSCMRPAEQRRCWLQGAVRQACTLGNLLVYNTNAPVGCCSLLSTSKSMSVETSFTP